MPFMDCLGVPVYGVAQQGGHQVNRLDQHIERRCMKATTVRNPQLALQRSPLQGFSNAFHGLSLYASIWEGPAAWPPG